MKTFAGALLVFCMMIVFVGGSFAMPMRAFFTVSGDGGSGAGNTSGEGEYSFTLPDYAAQLLQGDSGRIITDPPTITVRGNPCEVECKCELVKCQGNVISGQMTQRVILGERSEQLRGMRVCSGAYQGCQAGCTRYNN